MSPRPLIGGGPLWALALAPLLALTLLSAPAGAQEATPAAPAAAQGAAAQTPATAAAEAAREARLEELRYQHMWVAFGAVWLVLFVFVRQTYARSAAVSARLDELKGRLALLEGREGREGREGAGANGGARREEG